MDVVECVGEDLEMETARKDGKKGSGGGESGNGESRRVLEPVFALVVGEGNVGWESQGSEQKELFM